MTAFPDFPGLVGVPGRKFLVIDDNLENRFLLTRTIQRKYPRATVEECGDLALALHILRTTELDAVISHRAGEVDGIELVRALRLAQPAVPIVMVSGLDRTRDALAAGATRFLNYDEWLRVGTVIDEIFATQPWAALVSAISHAIRTRAMVGFDYASEAGTTHHEVEPHLLGETQVGELVLRAYAGKRAFAWETYHLPRIANFALTERTFAPHDDFPRASGLARVLCQV